MLWKLFAAWWLMSLCVVIHAAGVTFALRRLRPRFEAALEAWRWMWLFVRLAAWIVLLHLIEISIWALYYERQGAMPDLQSAFYFSAVTYTTTGYGDLVLPKEWRLLGAVEALTGILMCGWSTGFFFAILARMLQARTAAAVILVTLIGASSAAAQDQQRAYRPNPADEDWSFLENAPRVDFWDRVKYIPLGRDQWFMTVSGEVRYRPEGLRVRETDNRPSAVDNYLLQRYLLGADVRFGPRARVFTELQSGIVNGILRTPRPTDRNSVDLHQAFVELRPLVRGQHRLTVTVGRQELSVGSTRLISASPGLNVKRSFDGGAVSYRTPSWTVAGAVARLVRLTGGAFDDRWDTGQLFWGVAAGRRIPRFERGEMGAYYLGIDRAASLYVQALAAESRHTVGVKWAGTNGRLDLNYDGLFQWGSFARSSIRAWAFATETGYRWTGPRWRPRISVRADVATGDRDRTDPRLQTFNPLFPGNSYSGAVGLFGPSNLTDLTPALTFSPWPRVTLAVEAPSYWRSSTADGVYATDLRPIVLPDAGQGKYVGTNPGVIMVAQATRHLQLQGAVTRFLPGAFLKDTFVSSGFGFYSVSAVYRF